MYRDAAPFKYHTIGRLKFAFVPVKPRRNSRSIFNATNHNIFRSCCEGLGQTHATFQCNVAGNMLTGVFSEKSSRACQDLLPL